MCDEPLELNVGCLAFGVGVGDFFFCGFGLQGEFDSLADEVGTDGELGFADVFLGVIEQGEGEAVGLHEFLLQFEVVEVVACASNVHLELVGVGVAYADGYVFDGY